MAYKIPKDLGHLNLILFQMKGTLQVTHCRQFQELCQGNFQIPHFYQFIHSN